MHGGHNGAHDKQAEAIVQVLGSFENGSPQFDAAIESLNPEQLEAVINAGVDQKKYAYQNYSVNDPSQLNRIIEAASHSENIDTKTKIFTAATEKLDKLDLVGSGSVTKELVKLVDSDTRGIVEALRKEDMYGKSLQTYVEHVMKNDPKAENDALGRQLAEMQGSGTGKTAEEYFYETSPGDNNEPYPVNAANLGYFVGSVRAGLDNMKADASSQRAQMSSILTTAISVGTTVSGTGPAVSVFTTLTSRAISDGLNNVSDSNLDALGQEFQRMAMPPGAVGNSDAAEAFSTAVQVVRDQ